MNLYKIFENLRNKRPLIQNITNYVTSNDCANIFFFFLASPVMTDDPKDSKDIAYISDGLTINIGTLNEKTIDSMISAGIVSNKLEHPIVLDPVGVGASSLRTQTVNRIIENLRVTVIRGNVSEIRFLANGSDRPNGVDSSDKNEICYENVELFKKLSSRLGTIIVATSTVDIITDGNKVCFCKNGSSYMEKCQLSSVISAFISSNDLTFDATVAAVCSYGICGEIAKSRMSKADGNSSYRNYIIDAMFNLTPEILEKEAKYEIR